VPSAAAPRPSSDCAHFTVTWGRPSRCTSSQDASSGALVGAPAADHVDPGLAQTCGAARRGLAGIGDGEHHARDAGGDERFAARTGAAGVVARFEGDDGGRAARGIRPPRRRGSSARRLRREPCRLRGATLRRAPRRRRRAARRRPAG
jgi:hypothetical protein